MKLKEKLSYFYAALRTKCGMLHAALNVTESSFIFLNNFMILNEVLKTRWKSILQKRVTNY